MMSENAQIGYDAFARGDFDSPEEAFMVIFDVTSYNDPAWGIAWPEFERGWYLAQDDAFHDYPSDEEDFFGYGYEDDADAYGSAFGEGGY